MESWYCYRVATVIASPAEGTAAVISKMMVADGLVASECPGSLEHRMVAVEVATAGRRGGAVGTHWAWASTSDRTSTTEDAGNLGGRQPAGKAA